MYIKREYAKTVTVSNRWEELRPCFKNMDLCSKIIMALTSTINPALSNNDKINDLKTYGGAYKIVLSADQMEEMFGISKSSNPSVRRKQIMKSVSKLADQKVTIEDERTTAVHTIFPSIIYHHDESDVALEAVFNEALVPYIIDLRHIPYTTVPLIDILKLSSDYAIKLYILCMRYDKMRKNPYHYQIDAKAEYIRKLLNIPAGYTTGDFNAKIIDKYTKEISQKTGFDISWKGINEKGRKITKYSFLIKSKVIPAKKDNKENYKNDLNLNDFPLEHHKLIKYLKEMSVNKKTILDIYNEKGYDYLETLTKEVNEAYSRKLCSGEAVNYGSYFGGVYKKKAEKKHAEEQEVLNFAQTDKNDNCNDSSDLAQEYDWENVMGNTDFDINITPSSNITDTYEVKPNHYAVKEEEKQQEQNDLYDRIIAGDLDCINSFYRETLKAYIEKDEISDFFKMGLSQYAKSIGFKNLEELVEILKKYN